MSELLSISVSKAVFERLQKLATPLVDSTDTVIERLLDFWDGRSREGVRSRYSNSIVTPVFWKSSRGDVLRVGTELRGTYFGREFRALVERGGIRFDGKLYDNLSPAAIAAKNLAGTKGKAASTNGRDFWKLQDDATGKWVPVSVLRPSHRPRISADELRAELERAD